MEKLYKQWRKTGCSKKELAMAYAPGMKYDTANRRLRRWIHANPRLREGLKKVNYNDRSKMLRNEEVEIIFHFLGTP